MVGGGEAVVRCSRVRVRVRVRLLVIGALVFVCWSWVLPLGAQSDPSLDAEATDDEVNDDEVNDDEATVGESTDDEASSSEASELPSAETEDAVSSACPECIPCPACKPEPPKESEVVISDLLLDEQSVENYGVVHRSRPWEDREGDQNDWMRSSSGEWLQGELKHMREESVSFDSDEFDLQSIDWEDVAELHLPRNFDFVKKDKTVFTGKADMADGKLVIHTPDGDVTLDALDVMTVTQTHKREISKWYYKLSVGSTVRRGNTQSAEYSAFSRLRREDPFNRATLDYNGAYGLVSDEVNTNKHRGDLTWKLFISPVFYLTPVWGVLLYDEFQNIELRSLLGAGAGVHIVDTADVTFDFDLVAGYAATRYISVEEDDDQKVLDGVLVVPALTLEWDITDDVELDLSWQSSLLVTAIENSFHHGTARLSVEITDIFDLEMSAIYDRQESPVPDEDGDTPYKDDLSTTLSMALEFE